MSASFYDLMKYARTGIASPSMTYYDKQKALAMCKSGFPISTITGTTPLSFQSDGSPITIWSMIGNGQQTGTPTPDNPVMPDFCGTLDGTDWKIPITCAGQTTPVYLGEVPTVRRVKKLVLTGKEQWSLWSSGQPDVERYYYKWGKSTPSDYGLICTHLPFRTTDGNFEHIRLGGSSRDDFVIYISKTISPTVTDFKAYISAQYAAGTPVTVWYVLAEPETEIVNEPLSKIGDYADELHSEETTVSIPTVKGQNTLTVDTELQPSSVSLTGGIK